MAWIIATCLIAIAIMMIVTQLAISRAVMRMLENSPPLNAGEFRSDSRATELSFQTEDGLTLQACHFQQRAFVALACVARRGGRAPPAKRRPGHPT